MRVDQVIPSLASRDAIGVHTLALSTALRDAGIESDIFYGNCTPDVAEMGKPVTELGRNQKNRFLLYQSSIGSGVFDILAAREEPKLVNYHNITPAALLESWEPEVGHEVRLGRVQLERLAPEALLAVADSAYNETELLSCGYRNTEVVSLLIDITATGAPPDPATVARLRRDRQGGGADLLFVGKVSPHKAPHDLVKMLHVYRRCFDPAARLRLVGTPLGSTYFPALRAFIEELGLADAVEITGSLTPGELAAYYECVDLFVCASDHEGFCVPIVEALGHGLPVVAYGVAAIPETVGSGGIVLSDKTPLRFATAVHRVLTDELLRDRLSDAALERVAAYGIDGARRRFVDAVRTTVNA